MLGMVKLSVISCALKDLLERRTNPIAIYDQSDVLFQMPSDGHRCSDSISIIIHYHHTSNNPIQKTAHKSEKCWSRCFDKLLKRFCLKSNDVFTVMH